MSDHFDTEDGRTDITDLYLFPARGRDDRSVLVLDFNPEPSALELSFDPAASYEFKVDTNGDLEADIAFHVLFTPTSGTEATATLYRATGETARRTGAVGEIIIADAPMSIGESAHIAQSGGYRFFTGIRSDPHFKDVHGFRNDFQFTGHDPVAERNVIGIVLEVPKAELGAGGPIRIWGRTIVAVDGEVVTVDQAGRPGTNNAFNEPEVDRLEFDATPPTEQLTRFRDRFLAFLGSLGYSDAEAADLLPDYLPDVLPYDSAQPPGYPNGRRLTDDTADLLASLLTRGRVTSDLVGPHTDLLEEFPYLGAPHPTLNP
ncbi:MAG: DUF4331 family protein [Chloroflexota bacterium]